MNKNFENTETGETVEVPEIRPGIVNFYGCILAVSELTAYHQWREPESQQELQEFPNTANLPHQEQWVKK